MSENLSIHVAGEVRAGLARKQASQEQLAKHLGMSAGSLSRRLSGKTSFAIDELTATAEFLGVPLAALLPGVAA